MDDAEVPDMQLHFAPTWFIHDGAANPEGHGMTALPGVPEPAETALPELQHAFVADEVLTATKKAIGLDLYRFVIDQQRPASPRRDL